MQNSTFVTAKMALLALTAEMSENFSLAQGLSPSFPDLRQIKRFKARFVNYKDFKPILWPSQVVLAFFVAGE